jgi:hypothetical protein
MYRLALSASTQSSTASIKGLTAASDDSTMLRQAELQKQLRQAIRDSIIAEQVLAQQAKRKGRLSLMEMEQQRMARKQWELSNAVLKRVAEEQTYLIRLARQRKDNDVISRVEHQTEMHPRLQQAFAEACKNQEQPTLQRADSVYSENSPDIEDFIRQQEKALKSVTKKLQKSRHRQETQSQQERMNDHAPQHFMEFIRKQEQELDEIRRKTRSTHDRQSLSLNNDRPTHVSHGLASPKIRSFDEYIRREEVELENIQTKQRRNQHSSSSSNSVHSEMTSPSMSEFLKEQRMALESFQRQASQQRHPPSPPQSIAHSLAGPHHRYFKNRNPVLQPSKKLATPLQKVAQERTREFQQLPSLLVYNQKSSVQSLSTMEPSLYDAQLPPSTQTYNTRAPKQDITDIQQLPSMKTKERAPKQNITDLLPIFAIHPSCQETVISGVSDIISVFEQPAPDSNPNQDVIRKFLGSSENCCCLRHPNQLVREYTPVYKFDKVRVCRICNSENRAGGSRSLPNGNMAHVIGDIQQLQANKQEWRKKTNVMYHGKSEVSRSSVMSIMSHDDVDDEEDLKEDPLTDEEWMEQVRQRVLQVQAWESRSCLKYNPKVAKYFRMMKFGTWHKFIGFPVSF